MTNHRILSAVRIIRCVHIAGLVPAQFKSCVQIRKRNSEEGSLLVEVLVGMAILLFVFTATTTALAGMSDQRVRVEQRDRALALASSYDELSRTFKCGFVVDRISDSLTSTATVGSGLASFKNKVVNCDFKVKDGLNPEYSSARNAGDQDFIKREFLNRGNTSFQDFDIRIRYWYERAGTGDHEKTCAQISSTRDLPVILTRLIVVSWKERSTTRRIAIVKRDTVPTDNVVFALGNRVNIFVNKPTAEPEDSKWQARLIPYPAEPNFYIDKISDEVPLRNVGQPAKCAWFPYITPDGDVDGSRTINGQVTSIPTSLFPQGSGTV